MNENNEVEQPQDDRPEINYKAELERKTQKLRELEMRLAATQEATQAKKDPADLSTWSDLELKSVVSTNDPNFAVLKDQAGDILLERKVKKVREQERMHEMKEKSESELSEKYPEALDSTSEFSLRMNQVMRQYDLSRNPAGRLLAAKMVALEQGKGRAEADAAGRKKESERVRDVKAQLVDGDRPQPLQNSGPQDKAALRDKVMREKSENAEQLGKYMDETTKLREKFNKAWGY